MHEYEPDPSHTIFDEGWYVSDPICSKCRYGVYDPFIKYLCGGVQKQLEFEYD